MTHSPFYFQVHSAVLVAQELGGFWDQPENVAVTAIIGGAVGVYAISKLDVIKSMFSYFLILLGLCMIILIVPAFSETGTEQYAEQTLTLLNELLRSLIHWIQSKISPTMPAILGVINH